MGRIIHLTDNNIEGSYIDDGVLDILKIANIGKLRDNPDLLVFPYSMQNRTIISVIYQY